MFNFEYLKKKYNNPSICAKPAGPEEEKVLGSLLLPGYTIRPCLAGDRDRFVYRKYAFKAEHRNTRSFYLAADSRPSMIQWMNALSLAAILQDSKSLSTNNT